MTGNELRAAFIDYFVSKGHTHVKSAPLVPENDPTLLFTNAGMVQFKAVFTGQEKRDYVRAVTSQKCVRAGGKHNDLENVGRTARHHTFFEMLGNFSFGDYFKEDAIIYAWELLTEVFKLPKDRLWATVYTDDDEAHELWKRLTDIPEERILRLGEKDNFWAMGDTGPCGPCAEVLIDQGEEMSCGPGCGIGKCDCDRFLEVWNLVFMQYDRDEKGVLHPLPKPSIDTGMGLERLAAVVQGKHSNYDSDLFMPLIDAIGEVSGIRYKEDEKKDVSLKVIADHLRAMTFLIGEGVMPSNEGRGYVLRRIMRRAARHGKMLGLDKPFLYRMTGNVVDMMAGAYPELGDVREYVARVVQAEEERFIGTLDYGMGVLEKLMKEARKAGSKTLSGEGLFKLYDTFGFPMDLVEDIAGDEGFTLDMDGYNKAMDEQKAKAKSAWSGSGEQAVKPVYRQALEKAGPGTFVGYESTVADVKVVAVIKDGALAGEAAEGEQAELVLDTSPFYAESGGQVGDSGRILSGPARFDVHNTTRPLPGLSVHAGRVRSGTIKTGDRVKAIVDEHKRKSTERNHTATHMLHAVLRYLLGDHVKQAGSLVAPDRLRFDFSHFAPLTLHEKERVEEMMNEKILEAGCVDVEEMETEKALAGGATALFGEKYGDSVRVVKMGDFSAELCGGTHLHNTSEVGLFKLVSESGVAAGVRRIEAVTGEAALKLVKHRESELYEVAGLVKSADLDVSGKVAKIVERARELERELGDMKRKLSKEGAGDMLSRTKEIGGVKVLAEVVEGLGANELRDMGDELREKIGTGIIVLGSARDEKVSLLCIVTKDLLDRFKAGDIIKEAAKVTGGGGGGRPDMAQAGGKDASKLPEAMKKACEVVEKMAG